MIQRRFAAVHKCFQAIERTKAHISPNMLVKMSSFMWIALTGVSLLTFPMLMAKDYCTKEERKHDMQSCNKSANEQLNSGFQNAHHHHLNGEQMNIAATRCSRDLIS